LQAAVDGFSQVIGLAVWEPLPLWAREACLGQDPDFLARAVPGVHSLFRQPFAIVEVGFAQAIDVRRVQQSNPAIEGVVDYRNGIGL
jgi:hypothetical protein